MPRMTAALRLAILILNELHAQGAGPGCPLRAQSLADRWSVSRSPVNRALALLHARGLVDHTAGKGYTTGPGFLRPAGVATGAHLSALLQHLDPSQTGCPRSLADLCRTIADDRLAGDLPDTFSEAMLQARYGLTRSRLATLLGLLEHDGWANRHAGYGWTFSPLLTSPDTLLQASRSRMLLEPAALKEPGYHLAPAEIARCRKAEQRVLDEDNVDACASSAQPPARAPRASASDLHARGVQFHQTLAAASRNRFLMDALDRIHRLRTVLPHGAIQDPARTRQQAAEHLAILDALARGRVKNAAALLHRHLRGAHDQLEESLALTQVRKLR